jgi:MATE family multidrug resistance protein
MASGFFVWRFTMQATLDHPSQPLEGPRRRPLAELLLLAGPTVAQMSSYTLMQFADTWMLSKLGEAEAAAVGNSGMFAFTVISLGMGVLFMVNALVSQSYGRRDYAECGRYLWQGVWFSAGFAVLLLPAILLARPMFAGFGHEERLAGFEASYFRIVVSASVVKLAATAVGQFMLAVNRPSAVLVAAVCGVAWNTLFDWLMIFGKWGFPAWGVAGAAHATNMGVTVELIVLCLFAAMPKVRRQFNVADWPLRWAEMRGLLVFGLPSGFQIVFEVLAWSLFGVWVIGHFDTQGMAANQFMLRYMITAFMPCFGISAAVTALVGRYVGMRRPDLAARRAHLGFAVAGVYTVLCGIFFYTCRGPLMRLFSDDPVVVEWGMELLTVAAFYCFFDAMYIVYCGALRGASDTLAPAVATAVLVWTIMLGGGWVVARYRPEWGVAGPWWVATVYGILLGLYMLGRFVMGRWKQGVEAEDAASKLDGASAKVPGLEPT